MTNYNVGAIVTLKSGSPAMTVEESKADEAVCTWFDVQQTKQTATFKRQTLKAHRAAPNGTARK